MSAQLLLGGHRVDTTFDLDYFSLAIFELTWFCILKAVHYYSFQIEYMLPGMYNVERQASIKVSKLQGVSLICLTATQGGALRRADLCMPIAPSSNPYLELTLS